ncbi:MAG: serine hydrolase domain-containing protein, partial [Shimia sp.]
MDPTLIGGSADETIGSYDGPAPALIFEAYRGGVSVSAATGTVGFGDPAEATTEDKFEIGSQTKMMTATVLLQLVDEGYFSLDDRLADVMDVAPLSWMPNIEEATVGQLLTHRSGVPDFANDEGVQGAIEALLAQDPPQPIGPRAYLDLFEASGLPADFEPGAEYAYSNTGFLLLGLLIESATGTALADTYRTRIFDPAGMTSTSLPGFDRPDDILRSYTAAHGGLEVTDLPVADLGDGGVVSTTGDMIRFMKALLIDRTLVPEGRMEALAEYFSSGGGPEDLEFIGHGGGTYGTTSVTLFHPATGTIFSAAETMRYGPDVPSDLAFRAFFDLLENPAWTADHLDGDVVHLAVPAAELEISETAGPDGASGTLVKVGGVTLAFDGPLTAFDEGTLSFEDGSVLLVADAAGSDVRVAREAHD